MKKLFLALFVVLATVFVASALASPTPSLTLSPSPAYVGNTITGSGCGYQQYHWYQINTYGPNSTVDGPLVETYDFRGTGCISVPLFVPSVAGTYSTYVYACGAKGTGDGCVYGHHDKPIIDVDFVVN